MGSYIASVVLVVAVSLAGCSKSNKPGDVPLDAAPPDMSPPVQNCEQMQQDYVNRLIAPGQQADVATTVTAVLRAGDFPQAMPYCSGDRPAVD